MIRTSGLAAPGRVRVRSTFWMVIMSTTTASSTESVQKRRAARHGNLAIQKARQWAKYYRGMGFNPLPACEGLDDRGKPKKFPALKTWAHFRHEVVPESWVEDGGSWWTQNIQIVTGVAWGLAVVDIDGESGLDWWQDQVGQRGRLPNTWIIQTPSGGWHLWWRLPPDLSDCPSGDLWTGGGDHQGVELKADRSQVMAPPSNYGQGPYKFLKRSSPQEIPEPALIPDWVLALPRTASGLSPREGGPPRSILPFRPLQDRLACGEEPLRYDSRRVREGVDRVALAAETGLRFATTTPNESGFCRVHSIHREDVHPSAGFFAATGMYCEKGAGSLAFFDLLATLDPQQYPTWSHAVNSLGDRFGLDPLRSHFSRKTRI